MWVKGIKKFAVTIFLLPIFMLGGLVAKAQRLPPFQPEQDACNALTLCNNYFFTPYSYAGSGVVHDIDYNWTQGAVNCHVESNSVWFKVKIAAAGNIVFAIIPVDSANDYDFSVYNITGRNCADSTELANAKVRCNGNCNSRNGAGCVGYDPAIPLTAGRLGLDYVSHEQFVSGGTYGHAFLQSIPAQVGDEYLILVDNFSKSASGFALDFAGSTATFVSDTPPLTLDSVETICNTGFTTLRVAFNKPVLCNSIAKDGSDFMLVSSATAATAAASVNCTGVGNGYTREVMVTLSGALAIGSQYTLQVKNGSDGNSLLDICGTATPTNTAKIFEGKQLIKVDAGNDTALCAGGSVQLDAKLSGSANNRIRWTPTTYLNNSAIVNPVTTPTQSMEYVVLMVPTGMPSNCQYRDTIHITLLNGFNIITPDTVLCRPGGIPIHLHGDSAFTYTWSPPDYLSGTTGMLQNAAPKKSVTYTVKASYPACKDSVQTISIGLREWPDLQTADTIVCQRQPVPLQVVGGGNFTYAWSPNLYLSNSAEINPVATPDSNIIYTLTTSYTGCADSVQTVVIGVEPLPDITPVTFNTLCFGGKILMSPSVAPSGYSNYSYQWEPAAAFNNANAGNAVYTAINTGLISLKVSTPHGCADTLSQLISVSRLPVVNAGRDITVIEGQAFTLQGAADQQPATIKWTPASYLSSDNIINPTATLPASQNFVLSVSNEYGCTAKDSVFITILKDIHIPNAFSPNADGVNDVWNIPGLASYPSADVQIFNRWGQKVFENKGYGKPWDGSFKGKALPVGVYYYMIDLQSTLVAEGANGKFTGSVTVLR